MLFVSFATTFAITFCNIEPCVGDLKNYINKLCKCNSDLDLDLTMHYTTTFYCHLPDHVTK